MEFAGGRGVVVNFGAEDVTLPDGQGVKARDSVTFHATAAGRTYSPPPCPNVFAE